MNGEFLAAAFRGDLSHVQRMLADGEARITDADPTGITALLYATLGGSAALPTLIWLLREGGACISEADQNGTTALLHAAMGTGTLPTLILLLKKDGARLTERDHHGFSALQRAAACGRYTTCQWLLEHGGADIAEVNGLGQTDWGLLRRRGNIADNAVADATALLRVMVLRDAPPDDLVVQMRPEHVRVVEEGARLRAALPAYLARRRALLDAHCSLIAPLRALVRDNNPEPTTTDELWATGLGAAP
jgi:hypothetical protein